MSPLPATLACHGQACQLGSGPISWAKVNTLGELVPWPGLDRCNCWTSLNLRMVQKEGKGWNNSFSNPPPSNLPWKLRADLWESRNKNWRGCIRSLPEGLAFSDPEKRAVTVAWLLEGGVRVLKFAYPRVEFFNLGTVEHLEPDHSPGGHNAGG